MPRWVRPLHAFIAIIESLTGRRDVLRRHRLVLTMLSGSSVTGDPPAGLRPARAGHKSLANRWVPPGCAAGESGGGGSSVPPRNARNTLPRLEFSKAIGSNTAAYSLNTRYFCKPCSASALSPSPSALSDGRALRLRTAPVPLGAEQELPGQPGTGHCPGSRGGPAGSARPGTAP